MAHGNAHSNPFFISVLDVSAGGFEAFEHFFKHVSAEAGIPDDKAISIGCLDEPAPTRVSFSDNGIGLSEENLKENFCAFKRLNASEYPGGAIGVLLTQKLAERYEGRMRAESKYGQEATFNLRIPA